MKFNFLKIFTLVLLASLFVSSCKDDPTTPTAEKTVFEKEGVFLINEGSSNNGSISFIDAAGAIQADIFQEANDGAVIGKYVQSAAFIGDNVYLMAGGSAKVEVVSKKDMKAKATISNVPNNRYMIDGAGNKAYLSTWGATGMDGKIMIVNTEENKVVDSIELGGGPEMMLLSDDKLYVPNSGGYGSDSTLSIINTSNNTVTKTLEVGGCPTQILKSDDGVIWVLAAGCYAGFQQGNGHITKIEGDNATLVYEFPYGPLDNLTEMGDKLYVSSSMGVYTFDKATGFFAATPIIAGSIYGMDINKDAKKLYLSNTDYTNPNKIDVYNLESGAPVKETTITGGLNTGEFYFQK